MADVVERYRIVGENAVGAAFNQILRDSKSTADRMSKVFRTAFAGLSIYSVGRMLVGQIEFNDALARGAIQSGIQTKAYTELAFAARQLEIDQSALATSLKKMQVSLSQAGSGGKAQVEALAALGLEFKNLKSLEPDRQFELIAEQISKIKDPADRTRAAVELFGRAGADLLPLFERGAAGIREAREAAQAFGQSLTDDDLKKFKQADDALDSMKESARGLSTALTLQLSPAFVELSDKLTVLLGHGTTFQQLEVRIRDLQNISKQAIPVYFNFGYIDGAPVIMGPDKILEWMHKLRVEQLKLQTGYGTGIRGGRGMGAGSADAPGFAAAEGLAKAKEAAEKATAAYAKYRAELEEILALEKLTFQPIDLTKVETDFERTADPELDRMLQEQAEQNEKVFTEMFDNIGEDFKSTMVDMSVFAEQGFRNLQSHAADFLFDPFDKGLKGMLKGFIDVIRRMLAEAAAAQIFETLFKGFGGGGGGGGGFLGTLLGGLGGGIKLPRGVTPTVPSFGRGFASGGFMRPGEIGVVGERGPELAIAGNKGATIIPFDKARRSAMNVTISAPLSIDARGATPDAVKQLTAAMPGILRAHGDQLEARIVERMKRRMYD